MSAAFECGCSRTTCSEAYVDLLGKLKEGARTAPGARGELNATAIATERSLRKMASSRANLSIRRGLGTRTGANYKPSGPIDGAVHRWLGIPATQAATIVAMGLVAGAAMETFMVKVWIGQTNCMPPTCRFVYYYDECTAQ